MRRFPNVSNTIYYVNKRGGFARYLWPTNCCRLGRTGADDLTTEGLKNSNLSCPYKNYLKAVYSKHRQL